MMSQGHHQIYAPQPASLHYYHDARMAHVPASTPAQEPIREPAVASGAIRYHGHQTQRSTPPGSSSSSPYSSDPRCWSPGTGGVQTAPANTLPPITTLATATSAAAATAVAVAGEVRDARAKRKKSATPSRDGDAPDAAIEAARILEERRRRNASASARFRKRRNERERELVSRCLFLEHHLLQAVGAGAFDQLMRRAPSAAAIDGSTAAAAAAAVGVVGRRPAALAPVADLRDLRDLLPQDADADADSATTAVAATHPLSVSALTAPRSIDDVWSAYLSLAQHVSAVTQRVQSLEDCKK
ncbi:hypothetical protein IWW48_005718 [Coemansia sp. RSA 1200]|nr:hypothetical protein IWW48_005718 [Coemansia sp. RSA 1200]